MELDQKYIKKPILAWLHYIDQYKHGNICLVTPLFLFNGSAYELIDSRDFPDFGDIAVYIKDGGNAYDVCKRLGQFVRITIIKEHCSQWEDPDKKTNKYSLNYYKTKCIGSEILIEPFPSAEFLIEPFDKIQGRKSELTAAQDRLTELKAQKASIEQRNQELQADEESIKQAIAAMNSERDLLEKAIKDLKAELDSLEKQCDSTLEAFNDKAKQTARILDSKLLDRILHGVGEEPGKDSIVPFDQSLLHPEQMDYEDIIKRVADFIKDKAHRNVTYNDVANYLICITQGFITTFAGEPGTGKTSLCNILAKALGLARDDSQRRFVDISAERGWSSLKDFIGYYNPLTKSMEKSNIEVFNAFAKMDGEYDCEPSDIAPFIILLDEANLSPIEHYWAAFLRHCDFASASNRAITLGGSQSFKLPEHLRFLATVNFDHTTEELSPRFLDRSWVIMLGIKAEDDEHIENGDDEDIEYYDEDIENYEDMVSFGALKKAFSIWEEDDIDDVIQEKWKAIQEIFKKCSLQIMPRNLKMVHKYCTVACGCMETDDPNTRFAPLDYAFSQKILPTINGTGDNYRVLIEELIKVCPKQDMPISAAHLKRMKRAAENNMGFYQFFSR